MTLWKKYKKSFAENAELTAFCIGNSQYSYHEFAEYVSGCQQLLLANSHVQTGQPVGVMCRDSIETFAAIFAIWFSGAQFVPLNPQHPVLVNEEKNQQTGLQLILDSDPDSSSESLSAKVIQTSGIKNSQIPEILNKVDCAYILFTSGSTGKPKAVPISKSNLNAFAEAFLEIYPDLTSGDKFLQTYDLTSDAAFTGYLIPLLIGASVYTLPSGGFKYLNIVKLIQKHQITWTQFTPSVLNYLRPYFGSIRFDALKHSHFGGEALSAELVSEWAKCVPNAEISNIYGPTETTVTCTIHRSQPEDLNKHVYQGIISIGKPIGEVKIRIIGENLEELPSGEKGELCIGGQQLMAGYLNTAETPFIQFGDELYYRSGDIVFADRSGFLYFCGRIDDQLKINGFRVEPAEIELVLSDVCSGAKSKVFGFRNKSGTDSLVGFVEGAELNKTELNEQLRFRLASAFIPEKIISIACFPLNSNGKVDKSALFAAHSNEIYD